MSTPHTTQPSNHGGSHQSLFARASEFGSDALTAATQVGKQVQKTAGRAERLAKDSPWLAAGTMLGAGLILGAIGYRIFGGPPAPARD